MGIRKLRESFNYAGSGVKQMIGDQQNFQIQLVFGAIIIILALILRFDVIRLSIILIVISQVLSLEMANTALEKYIDHVSPGEHRTVGLVKDFLAGAVLLSVISAVIVGTLVFYQSIMNFFS